MRAIGIAAGCLVAVALAACQGTPQQQNAAVGTAAGAAIGAGLGMAVANEDDKTEGALVGGGVGALLGNLAAQHMSGGRTQPPQAAQSAPVPRQQQAAATIADPNQRAIQSAYEYAVQQALSTNSIQNWAAAGANGTVYPTATWTEHGLMCRSYDSTYRERGQQGQVSGSLCRQPDGHWK